MDAWPVCGYPIMFGGDVGDYAVGRDNLCFVVIRGTKRLKMY